MNLDELEKLTKAVTAAPWRSQWGSVFGEVGTVLQMGSNDVTTDEHYANADFVVAVRNDIDELLRLARLGAAVEAMPKGWVLEREDWSEHAWSGHTGSLETTLQSTPQEVLDDIQRLLKIT